MITRSRSTAIAEIACHVSRLPFSCIMSSLQEFLAISTKN